MSPASAPIGVGGALAADSATRAYNGGRVLVSGSHVLRLTPGGAVVAARLLGGEPVGARADGLLARRLVEAGLAHVVVAANVPVPAYEVVIPTYGTRAFDRSLPAVVVDDGSPEPVHDVPPGMRVVRHDGNRGPAAARNTGLRATTAEFVAFVDSDARIDADSLDALARVLAADPALGAVAPRIRPGYSGPTVLRRFATALSPLDMGPRSGSVGRGRPVPYVPSTVLVVRRTAFDSVGGFDEHMRIGEDVDLVWRLVSGGWSVRYHAEVEATHDEPVTWQGWLHRRMRYGTSEGPLARRHQHRRERPAIGRVPTIAMTRIAAQEAVGVSRWLTQTWWPLLALGMTRRRSRPLCATALLAPSAVEYVRRRPHLDPLRWAAAVLADDIAYGAGVWVGSVRERTARPLLPRLVIRRTRGRNVSHQR